MSSAITDSVCLNNILNLGLAPIASVGLVELAMASSMANVMSNSATAEKNSQTIQTAIVSQCCVLIISAGAAGATKG